MLLNYRTAQTTDDMPSSHPGHLRHLRLLGHLSDLGTLSNLNTLDLYSLDLTLTDSPLQAFITEVDPTDSCLSEGYYEDDSLDPLPVTTPLLLTPRRPTQDR
jgi:hypothetical protein